MNDNTRCVYPDQAEVALGGYSPVSYFEKGRAELGSAEHSVTHAGRTYHLASAEQVETFRANPEAYLPEHEGWCAYGAEMGKQFPVDPENFKIVDGRLLLFLVNEELDARQLWEQEHASNCASDACHAATD